LGKKVFKTRAKWFRGGWKKRKSRRKKSKTGEQNGGENRHTEIEPEKSFGKGGKAQEKEVCPLAKRPKRVRDRREL